MEYKDIDDCEVIPEKLVVGWHTALLHVDTLYTMSLKNLMEPGWESDPK